MEKKNVVFLTVLAIATLLTAVVGTTFAYFTATVEGNEQAKTTSVTTANLSVAYSDGPQITATGIIPGWISRTITSYTCDSGYRLSDTTCVNESNADDTKDATPVYSVGKAISVTNNSTIPVTYTISWTDLTNEFITVQKDASGNYTPEQLAAATSGSNDFVYRLYKNSVDPANIVGTETAVPTIAGELTHATINANSTDNYILVLEFKETSIKQNENQGKSFTAKLQTSVANTGA